MADVKGDFPLPAIPPTNYLLKLTYLGWEPPQTWDGPGRLLPHPSPPLCLMLAITGVCGVYTAVMSDIIGLSMINLQEIDEVIEYSSP